MKFDATKDMTDKVNPADSEEEVIRVLLYFKLSSPLYNLGNEV